MLAIIHMLKRLTLPTGWQSCLSLICVAIAASLTILPTAKADPGAEIPKPRQTLEEALKLSRTQFQKEAKTAGIPEEQMKDWIIIRAEYVLIDEKQRTDPWPWLITFTHRIYNDRQCIIEVLPDGKLKSMGIIGK